MLRSKRRTHVRRTNARRRLSKRRGVAVAEFAIVLPVLVALTLGTIDLCTLIFLKESVVLAAYEGARIGVNRGRTNQDVIDRVQQFLDERGISYTGNPVSFEGVDFDNAQTLENVKTTVSVPISGNLLIPTDFWGGGQIQAYVVLRKEYKNLDNTEL